MRTYLHVLLKASVFLLCFSKGMLNSCNYELTYLSVPGIEFIFQNYFFIPLGFVLHTFKCLFGKMPLVRTTFIGI